MTTRRRARRARIQYNYARRDLKHATLRWHKDDRPSCDRFDPANWDALDYWSYARRGVVSARRIARLGGVMGLRLTPVEHGHDSDGNEYLSLRIDKP